MQKILLLDLGNVVVQVNFAPFLSWLGERARINDEKKIQGLLGSSLFYDFEFGNIGREEFVARVGKLFEAKIDLADFEERFCGIFPGMVEGMGDLIEELSREGDVYCLTNTNQIHLNFIRERFPVMSKFKRTFASFEMHKRKPYPGIYRDVSKELGVFPGDLVFFDDVQANVDGAAKAGLEAHLFQTVSEVRQILKPGKDLDDKKREGVL